MSFFSDNLEPFLYCFISLPDYNIARKRNRKSHCKHDSTHAYIVGFDKPNQYARQNIFKNFIDQIQTYITHNQQHNF